MEYQGIVGGGTCCFYAHFTDHKPQPFSLRDQLCENYIVMAL